MFAGPSLESGSLAQAAVEEKAREQAENIGGFKRRHAQQSEPPAVTPDWNRVTASQWSIPTRCTLLVQAETDKRLAERERHLESCQEQLNMEKVSCG